MKNKQLWQKAGSLILSAALAVSCLSGVPAADASAAGTAPAGWKSELYIDFGTGTNIDGQTDPDLATNYLLPEQIERTPSENLIAGYGSWLYDSMDVGTAYGEAATTQKIGFDRAMPAGVTEPNLGGQYFRDWIFSPDGEAYTFSVDLPVGQYHIYVYTGSKPAGYNNTSLISFSDNGHQITYDQSSNGGGQYQPPGCIYVVNVTEKSSGCGYGTLGVKVFDNTIVTTDDGYDASYTSSNTVFYGTDTNTTFIANGNPNAVDGKIATARLNGIEIMPVENPVYAESVVASETDTNISVETKQTITLSAKAAPEGATERVEYFSSDESIAKVNPKTGELTGIAPGSATITATTPSLIGNTAKSVVYNVTVYEETTLTLDPTSVSLQVGGSEGADTKTVKATFDAASLEDAQSALITSVTSSIAAITFGDVTEVTAPSEEAKGVYSQDITIRATDKGSETISIARTTGRTADLRISVTKPVTSIKFYDAAGNETTKYTTSVGNSLTVSAKALPEDASNTNVRYKFKESTDIATITGSGKITAKKAGTAIIQATSSSNSEVIAEAALTINPGFSISYNTAAITMNIGATIKNALTIAYDEGVDKTLLNTNVSYSSSDQTVAEVGNDGTVKAKKAGTAVITATAEDGGQKATYTVTVTQSAKQPATSLTVDKKTITLNINNKKTKTAQIKATLLPAGNADSVTFTSNKPQIVKVDQNGIVTALKTGTAKITVKSTNGLSQIVTVKVTSPATKVKITGKKTIKFKKGKKNTIKLKATVTPKKSTDKVKWSTSNKKIATVSKKGVVTVKKKGKVKITAKAGKKKATIKITIK